MQVEGNRLLDLREDGLWLRTLCDEEELKASYRLRHQVFAERLQWVTSSEDGMEIDSYDAFATAVGLFDQNHRLRGVFRMIHRPYHFMLESEFQACLLPGCQIRREQDTAEITRLAIDPTLTDRGLSIRLMQVLFKGVYQWSIQNDIRFLYMVVEKRFLRGLRGMGFTCEAVSPAVSLPPAGAVSIAAVLDWKRFHDTCPQQRPDFFRWINTVDGTMAFERSGFLAQDPKSEDFRAAEARTLVAV
ncbi:MAG TPA: acyl-homoserine-lactone synthase [Nitrospira sp.]|nr:acyl-homoserine-lactone synthase [Nitrospira sp.]